jgi:hypothetical protein
MFSKGNNTNIRKLPNYREQSDELDLETMMPRKELSRMIQRYDLNMRRRRASVTIRVRQSGHSRDEDMMRSEQLRHIAKWLQKKGIRQRAEAVAKKLNTYPQSTMAILASSS